MKIAIVVPYIGKIEGNRLSLVLARDLGEDNDVIVFSHTVQEDQISLVKRVIGDVQFKFIREVKFAKYGIRFAFRFQFSRGADRKLAMFIDRYGPFDLIMIIANEGKWIPQYIHNRNKNTKIAISVMELHDHGFISIQNTGYSGFLKRIPVISLLYPIMKWFEFNRFRKFDLIFANSSWTSVVFEYLYGIKPLMTLAAVDEKLFRPMAKRKYDYDFIAVPTVSLGKDEYGKILLKRLAEDGITLMCYGPLEIPGLRNLGYVSDEEMVQILSDAKATLFLFNYEALGLVPIESLMCGTPTITYNKQGPGIELRDNSHAHFFQGYDDLKAICIELLKRSKTIEDQNEIRNSVMNFSSKKVIEKLFSIVTKEEA